MITELRNGVRADRSDRARVRSTALVDAPGCAMCDYAPNREAAMAVVERDAGGKPTVWCDPCIEPFIRALNAAGLRTVASCCGHGTVPGWIALADGKQLAVLPNLDDYHRVIRPE